MVLDLLFDDPIIWFTSYVLRVLKIIPVKFLLLLKAGSMRFTFGYEVHITRRGY